MYNALFFAQEEGEELMSANGHGARDDASVVKGAMQPQEETAETGSVPLSESGSTNLGQVQARVFLALLAEFFAGVKKPIPAERALEIARQFVSGNSQSGPAVMLNYLENDKKVIIRDLSRSHYRTVIPRHSANVTIGERKDPLWPLDGWKETPLPELVERIREVAGRIGKRGLVRVPVPSPSSENAAPPQPIAETAAEPEETKAEVAASAADDVPPVEVAAVPAEAPAAGAPEAVTTASVKPVHLTPQHGRCYQALVEAGRKDGFERQSPQWFRDVLESVPSHGFIAGVISDLEKAGMLEPVDGVKRSHKNPCIRKIHLRPYTVDGVNVIVPTAEAPLPDASDIEPEPAVPVAEAEPPKSERLLPSRTELENRLATAEADLTDAREREEERQQSLAALRKREKDLTRLINEHRRAIETIERDIKDAESELERHKDMITERESSPIDFAALEAKKTRIKRLIDTYDELLREFDGI